MCIRNNVRHPSCTPETTSVRPHCGYRNPVFGHPYVHQKHVSAPSCGHVRHDSMLQAMLRYTSGHFLCIKNNFRELPVCIINVWATSYVHQKPHGGRTNYVCGHPRMYRKHVGAPSCGHVRHDSMPLYLCGNQIPLCAPETVSGHFLCVSETTSGHLLCTHETTSVDGTVHVGPTSVGPQICTRKHVGVPSSGHVEALQYAPVCASEPDGCTDAL